MPPKPCPHIPLRFDEPLTACPLCGSGAIGYFDHDFQQRTLFRCRDCATGFMNPQYSDDYLREFYAQYFQEDDRTSDLPRLRRRVTSKLDDLRLVGRYIEPGRFLSIGCGDGLELELAEQLGWEAEGYDIDGPTTERVMRRLGNAVHTGDFRGLDLADETYDCIFMDQVLEHPKNPQEYLREANRLLRPGGVLFIGCPNAASITFFVQTWLGRLGLKRRRGRHYGMFHHLYCYSPKQLTRVLEQLYGFEVLIAEGDPLCGEGRRLLAGSWLGAGLGYLRRTLPFLEGTFRLAARKRPIPLTRRASEGVTPKTSALAGAAR